MRKWIVGLATLAVAVFLVLGFGARGAVTSTGAAAEQVRATSFGSRLLLPPEPVVPTHVLMIGDSLPFGIAEHLQDAMNSYGDQVQFVSDAYPGASLFFGHVEGVGPLDEIAGDLDANPDTNVVIASFGGICWQDILPFECGSPLATANWVAAQSRVVDEVRAHGMKLLWAVTPTVAPDASDYPGWPEIQQATIKNMKALGVPLIRWDQYLSPRGDGAYTPAMPLTLLGAEPTWYDVRKADGAHITSVADLFLAEQTARDWWEWA